MGGATPPTAARPPRGARRTPTPTAYKGEPRCGAAAILLPAPSRALAGRSRTASAFHPRAHFPAPLPARWLPVPRGGGVAAAILEATAAARAQTPSEGVLWGAAPGRAGDRTRAGLGHGAERALRPAARGARRPLRPRCVSEWDPGACPRQ